MLKILLIVLLVPALLSAVVLGIGFLLPQDHVTTRTMLLRQSREAVYAVISQVEAAPAWRTDVESTEILPGAGGEKRYREKTRHGTLAYLVVKAEAPARFVTEIAEKDAPFGGRWIFDLSEEAGGTRITITERGKIYNPAFRFFARFVFGYHRTMETYLGHLAKKFGETPAIEEGKPGSL